MQRVKKISLPYTQKHIDGYHKVFIGEFQTRAAAASVLAKVRESVQANAFITVEREGPVLKPRQKMQQAMLMAKARTLKKMKEDESKHITKELAAVSPIKVSGPQEEIVVVKKDIKRVVEKVEDVKTKEALSKEAPQNLFCKSSKNRFGRQRYPRLWPFIRVLRIIGLESRLLTAAVVLSLIHI